MRRGLLLLVLLAACGPWDPRARQAATSQGEAQTQLAEARAEADAGRPKNAVVLYERIAHDFARTDAAAIALHELAMLRLDLRSPVRDQRMAQQTLARLAKDYPKTRWGREATAWRVLFRQVARCEEEASRAGADAERLRQTIESLKDSDADLGEVP